jgi:hypothetical protein
LSLKSHIWSWCLLSHSTPWRQLGAVEVDLHSFLTSALDGGEWSLSNLGLFAPGEEPKYQLDRSLCGPQSLSGCIAHARIQTHSIVIMVTTLSQLSCFRCCWRCLLSVLELNLICIVFAPHLFLTGFVLLLSPVPYAIAVRYCMLLHYISFKYCQHVGQLCQLCIWILVFSAYVILSLLFCCISLSVGLSVFSPSKFCTSHLL